MWTRARRSARGLVTNNFHAALKALLAKLVQTGPAVGAWPAGRPGPTDALRLLALWSLAGAQPLYDKLAQRGAFLGDLGADAALLAGLVATLSLGIPLLLIIPGAILARLAPRAFAPVFAMAMFVLWVLLLLPVCKRLPGLGAAAVLAAALFGGAAATVLCARYRAVRRMLTVASVGVVLFPLIFWQSRAVRAVLSPAVGQTQVQANAAPIVMVVFDEFCGAALLDETGRIDARRFPNFARLARQSTWFPNATTVHAYTRLALPAILSGRLPPPVWMPMPADLPQTLFSLLEATGVYEQAVFEPVSRLASNRSDFSRGKPIRRADQTAYLATTLLRVYLEHICPAEFSRKLPRIPKLWFGLRESLSVDITRQRGVFRYDWGERRDQQFAHFLRCIDGGQRPALYFIHVLLPHLPWCYLPTGERYAPDGDQWGLASFAISDGPGDFWGSDEHFVMQGQQRHLLQLAYVDRLVGQLLDRLEETGLWQRCLFIATADHGVAFRANEPRRTIAPAVRDEILFIPLFIKRPGQAAGAVSRRPVQLIDLLPTIADLLGMRLPLPVDGRSVFDESAPHRTQTTYLDVRERPVTIAAPSIGTQVARTIRERFGESGDPEALFRAGPAPELCGRRASEFDSGAASGYAIELLAVTNDQSLPKDELVPCYFEGYVRPRPPLNEPVMLAVAIDGTIRAVTRTYLLQGLHDRFAALVPPSSVRGEPHEVSYFEVTRGPSGWRLARCSLLAPGNSPGN